MQSTFLSSSSHSITTQFHQYPCPKSSPFQIPTTNNSNKTPNFLPKTITLTKSLRTSINYEHHHHQGGLGDDCGPLPVVIKQSGKVSRYFWDGNLVKLVSVDVSGDGSGLSDGLGGWVRNLLLPKEVNENYMEYVKWKFVHRVFSSALKVLATQVANNAFFPVRLQASLPFVVYPFFATIDLFALYQGLKHVHLQTLTKDRLEIILDAWIKKKCVPSPAEVSKEEGIDFFWSNRNNSWPIRIGYLNPNSKISKYSMMAMKSLSEKDKYFICVESFPRWLKKTEGHGILLCLREGASTTDIIMGLLQACHVRKDLGSSNRWEDIIGCDTSELSINKFSYLMEDSKRCAEEDFLQLKMQLEEGWVVKNILLNTLEEVRYSFVCKDSE
ncbi:hypothetical protein ACFE04_001920 [Oxalis oulophora]